MVYVTGKAQHPAWKILKALFIVSLLAGTIALYLYLHPDLWQKWVKGTPLEQPPTVTKTYKWKNDKGEWQITDRPPPGDIEYETRIYKSDTNIVPSLETPEK
ncbi:MAG TPA: hypothetical protein VJ981_05120 [Gammaproteobacteria bacterium]|nr:hypothetical protein [Gammaproteobacteria bacterium]